jgi:hypothetical protein
MDVYGYNFNICTEEFKKKPIKAMRKPVYM